MLNYTKAQVLYHSARYLFEKGNHSSAVNILLCQGDEDDIEECDLHYSKGNDQCDEYNAVGVSCVIEPNAPLKFRLENGSGSNEGRLQVNINGLWVGFQAPDIEFTKWICQSLNYSDVHSIDGLPDQVSFGLVKERLILDYITCVPSLSVTICELHQDPSMEAQVIKDAPRNEDEDHQDNAEVDQGLSSNDGATEADNPVQVTTASPPMAGQIQEGGDVPSTVTGCKTVGQDLLQSDCVFRDIFTDNRQQVGYGCKSLDVYLSEGINLTQASTSHQGFVMLKPSQGHPRPICVINDNAADDVTFGHAVCRKLGYNRANDLSAKEFLGQPTGDIYTAVQCLGDHFDSCQFYKHVSDAICPGSRLLHLECIKEEYKLRLANGSRTNNGRLEMLVADEWRTFCASDTTSMDVAHLLCQYFGYSKAMVIYMDGTFGSGEAAFVDSISCTTGRCTYSKNYEQYCNESALGLDCHRQEGTGSDITVDSLIYQDTKIPILDFNPGSRPICVHDKSWDSANNLHKPFADQVCRSLRFAGASMIDLMDVQGTATSGQFVSLVSCPLYGDLHDCTFEAKDRDCQHVLKVICHDEDIINVHLRGGHGDFEGWIEVSQGLGLVGAVCGLSQSESFFHAVCRSLGYERAVYSTMYVPIDALNDTRLEYGKFSCPEDTSTLSDCFINNFRLEDCMHGAGVICNSDEPLPVRLVGHPDQPSSGRVEVKLFSKWTGICNTYETKLLGSVLCSQLGYSPYKWSLWTSPTQLDGGLEDLYIPGKASCAEGARDLKSCLLESRLWSSDVYAMRPDLGISCDPDPFNPCDFLGALYPCDSVNGGCTYNGTSIPVCWCRDGYTLTEDGRTCTGAITEVRLVKGTGPDDGILEVLFEGDWTSVCFYSLIYYSHRNNLNTICRMLGFKRYLRVMSGLNWEEETSKNTIDVRRWNCKETDMSMENCAQVPHYNVYSSTCESVVHLTCLTDNFQLRLAGTGYPNIGRVEVTTGTGEWGVICHKLTSEIRESICTDLGFNPSLAQEMTYDLSNSLLFAARALKLYNPGVSYNTSNRQLYFRGSLDQCVSQKAVGLRCMNTSLDVRIRPQSEAPFEGTPEVLLADTTHAWARVCISNLKEGHWFCSRLGFPGVLAISGTGQDYSYQVVTSGTLGYVVRGYTPSLFTCRGSHLICNANQMLSVRLANGTAPYEGRVEIQHLGKWTLVAACQYSIFQPPDIDTIANITCSSLGYGQVDSFQLISEKVLHSDEVDFMNPTCESNDISSCQFSLLSCSYRKMYPISVTCRKDTFDPCNQQGWLYPCDPINGGCVTHPNHTHVCTCLDGWVLDSDNKTCVQLDSDLQVLSGFLPSGLQESFAALTSDVNGEGSTNQTINSPVALTRRLDSFLEDMLQANITDLVHVVKDDIELFALAMDSRQEVYSIQFGLDNDSMANLPEISIPVAALLGGDKGSYIAGVFAVIKINTTNTDPIYHNISDSSKSGFLNSDVVTIKLSGVNTTLLKENITVSFPLAQTAEDGYSPHCAFLEQEQIISTWSLRGCERKRVINGADDIITCSCNHLTSFAVLMLPNDDTSHKAHDFVLSIMTYIGLTLSIASLILSLAAFFISKIKTTRVFLMKNQCFVMIMAQLLFATGVEHAKGSKVACGIVAGVTHLLFLTVFTWMLNQGIYILLQLGIRRFTNVRISKWQYVLLGWGIPVIIVGITSAVDYGVYIEGEYCWLATVRGGVYAFIGPVIAVIVVNAGILLYAIIAFTSVKAFKNKSEKGKIRSTLRAVSILCPILGTTWILGLFVRVNIFLQYSFVILNSTQGVLLFIFQVLLNEEVYEGVKKRLRRSAIYPLVASHTSDTENKSVTNPTLSTGGDCKKLQGNTSQTMNMEILSLHDNDI